MKIFLAFSSIYLILLLGLQIALCERLNTPNEANLPRAHQNFVATPFRVPSVQLKATWYDNQHCFGCNQQRIMANGEILRDDRPTCAANDYKLGTWLLLEYKGKFATCQVTDRMLNNNMLDLTPFVFNQLENPSKGVIKLEVSKL